MQKYYRTRVDQGLCSQCGHPRERMKVTTCNSCHARDGVKTAQRRKKRLQEGTCTQCGLCPSTTTTRCDNCSGKAKTNNKTWRQRLKEETMNAYGGKCACCGEHTIQFLTIDHIDGREQPSSSKTLGTSLYSTLKAKGYPTENIQVLCFNCNSAKYQCGTCPHQA
ncbi:hypothetical protein LCGC14_2493630 [marine sediment metagenome]|uniref:Uncharacterized protein n=1 Tax=marine sediment metagenome TaxID=412755 RepID=A0A0F9DXR0_9ZZZZ